MNARKKSGAGPEGPTPRQEDGDERALRNFRGSFVDASFRQRALLRGGPLLRAR